MLSIFNGLFDGTNSSVIEVSDFLLCVGASFLIGLILALFYMYKSKSTRSFLVTLAILPMIVCVVIMMVNGNIGAGVAVAGAFSLVRFRSAQGTAQEICAIFIGMASGLICGMGYLAYALLFTIIVGIVYIIYSSVHVGSVEFEKTMKITVPEDLNYSDLFSDLFLEYTKNSELIHVKTTNMGSLYQLTYELTLIDNKKEKEFIDKLRCRNGNLEVNIFRHETNNTIL